MVRSVCRLSLVCAIALFVIGCASGANLWRTVQEHFASGISQPHGMATAQETGLDAFPEPQVNAAARPNAGAQNAASRRPLEQKSSTKTLALSSELKDLLSKNSDQWSSLLGSIKTPNIAVAAAGSYAAGRAKIPDHLKSDGKSYETKDSSFAGGGVAGAISYAFGAFLAHNVLLAGDYDDSIEPVCAATLELKSRLGEIKETLIPQDFLERARACAKGRPAVREYLAHNVYGSPYGQEQSGKQPRSPSVSSRAGPDTAATLAPTPALPPRDAGSADALEKTLSTETPTQSNSLPVH